MVYGYARVSTICQAKEGNSLDIQEKRLLEAGAEKIYKDTFTGSKTSRPELNKLLQLVTKGDTLIVTKLDRIARSVTHGSELIQSLIDKGVTVNVLNMGKMDSTASGKLLTHIMLSFAEFERDLIMERTQEGRMASGNFGGRPDKYTLAQKDHAMELLKTHSYSQVAEMTGISTSTLAREKEKRRNTYAGI